MAGDAGALQEPPRLIPFAQNIYHAGNRAYVPQLGRWLQPDPNATAQTLLSNAMHGSEAFAAISAFDFDALFGDGANLYEYLGSNPWLRFDPTGLSWDPFSMVDDYLAESAGERAAFLNHIGLGAVGAATFVAHLASSLPFPGVSIMGDLTLVALGKQSMADAIANQLLGFGMGKMMTMAGSKLIGTGMASLGQTAAMYAAKAGAKLGGKALRFMRYGSSVAHRVAGYEWHHILPKFLGGAAADGFAALMKTEHHRQYHAILRQYLGNAVPGSGNWSGKAWETFIESSAENAKTVYDALLSATAKFDMDVPGYGLFGKLLREVNVQNWAPNL